MCKESSNEVKCQCASLDQRIYLKANPAKKYTIHSCTDLILHIRLEDEYQSDQPVRTALLVANKLEIKDTHVNHLELFSDANFNRLTNISARDSFMTSHQKRQSSNGTKWKNISWTVAEGASLNTSEQEICRVVTFGQTPTTHKISAK